MSAQIRDIIDPKSKEINDNRSGTGALSIRGGESMFNKSLKSGSIALETPTKIKESVAGKEPSSKE